MKKSIVDRFEEKFTPEPNSGCWLWEASRNHKGYGNFRMTHIYLAHRASYALYKGAIPEGLCVLHKCDVPACVNPDHLFLGTHLDNAVDRMEKGRSQAGEHHVRAKLTKEAVTDIRSKYQRWKYTYQDLADEYGVSNSTIYNVVAGVNWKC